MALSTTEKKQIITDYQCSTEDTGSVEVQAALLTRSILKLTEHLKTNKKDIHSYQGLRQQINQRHKLLKYLKQNNLDRYRALVQRLGVRES